MYLFIDTSTQGQLILKLFNKIGVIGELNKSGGVKLTEELTVTIEKLLASKGAKLSGLKGVVVVSGPGGFTSLRVGCLVANMFGQLLNIPVYGELAEKLRTDKQIIAGISKMKKGKVVLPQYGREPNITIANR